LLAQPTHQAITVTLTVVVAVCPAESVTVKRTTQIPGSK
jgi:hypothetical protein